MGDTAREKEMSVEEANTKCDEHLMLCSQVTDLRTDIKQIKYISWTTLIGFATACFWYIIKLNETVIHDKVAQTAYFCLSKIITVVLGAGR